MSLQNGGTTKKLLLFDCMEQTPKADIYCREERKTKEKVKQETEGERDRKGANRMIAHAAC